MEMKCKERQWMKMLVLLALHYFSTETIRTVKEGKEYCWDRSVYAI